MSKDYWINFGFEISKLNNQSNLLYFYVYIIEMFKTLESTLFHHFSLTSH